MSQLMGHWAIVYATGLSPCSQPLWRLTHAQQEAAERLVPLVPAVQYILRKAGPMDKRDEHVLVLHVEGEEEADLVPCRKVLYTRDIHCVRRWGGVT